MNNRLHELTVFGLKFLTDDPKLIDKLEAGLVQGGVERLYNPGNQAMDPERESIFPDLSAACLDAVRQVESQGLRAVALLHINGRVQARADIEYGAYASNWVPVCGPQDRPTTPIEKLSRD